MLTSVYPLILNSSNLVPSSSNNTYRYVFPTGSYQFQNAKVAVSSISIYYSWFNITAAQGNNTFQYRFYTLAGSNLRSVTVPDGFYSVSELNSYLQSLMITNGEYLMDASGDYVYYLEFIVNPNYYGVQLNSYPIPTSLPAGYSNPAAMTFPAVASCPLLIVAATNFRNLIGFNSGTYPSVTQATNYSKISDYCPQVSPVQSMIMTCSLLNNKFSNPNTMLYSFTTNGTSYGSLITASPNELMWVDIQNGQYNFIDCVFLDQSLNNLNIVDTNLCVNCLIKTEN